MQYIISIGIFQALVAIALLWKNKLRKGADDLLILLVGCIATHLAIKFVIFNFINDEQVRYQMNTFMGLCYGPLLYLYAIKARDASFVPASRWYVFLPFIIGAISYFTVAGVLFYSSSAGYRLLKSYNEISFWVLVLSDLFFVFLALKETRSYKLETATREKQMVQRIAWCFIVISALSFLFYGITHIFGRGYSIIFRSIIYAILAGLSVMIIRYKYVAISHVMEPVLPEEAALLYPETEDQIVAAPADPASVLEPLVRKPSLSQEEQRQIWISLEQQIRQNKIFTDSELNLDKLAQATGINKYHISETLNSFAHKSFYQYVNEYRIDFALNQMQLLREKSIPVNVLSLAYDAGFKAKSSFNRYFKDITGLTPTEYLKSLQQIEIVGKSALG